MFYGALALGWVDRLYVGFVILCIAQVVGISIILYFINAPRYLIAINAVAFIGFLASLISYLRGSWLSYGLSSFVAGAMFYGTFRSAVFELLAGGFFLGLSHLGGSLVFLIAGVLSIIMIGRTLSRP